MELKTIVFDWGDTLMVNLPEYDGAMKNWPVVKAVSGIKQVLETLSKKYQLVAASNAVDSNANDVRMALKRENLNEYFDKVYTASELGSRKPHKEFFFKIQESVGVTAQECVMVGDSWADDVNGALSAGWKAIWFNRNIQPCPALSPHHHAEYYQTHELIAIINHELLPDWNTCETWM
ncbi:MAG: HAD family hydrolase, partial [Anaerolineae bacterium]|nr:HAD family hydrolase [Anaerolineae bacterium]